MECKMVRRGESVRGASIDLSADRILIASDTPRHVHLLPIIMGSTCGLSHVISGVPAGPLRLRESGDLFLVEGEWVYVVGTSWYQLGSLWASTEVRCSA